MPPSRSQGGMPCGGQREHFTGLGRLASGVRPEHEAAGDLELFSKHVADPRPRCIRVRGQRGLHIIAKSIIVEQGRSEVNLSRVAVSRVAASARPRHARVPGACAIEQVDPDRQATGCEGVVGIDSSVEAPESTGGRLERLFTDDPRQWPHVQLDASPPSVAPLESATTGPDPRTIGHIRAVSR